MGSDHSCINDLNEKIRILQLENEQLTERAEDSLMLGLISEVIQPLFKRDDILDLGLERVSLLKRLPLVACSTVENSSLRIHKSYLSVSHENIDGSMISVDAALLKKLDTGEAHVSHADYALLDRVLAEKKINFSPRQIMLVPFFQPGQGKFVFIFADTETEPKRLSQMLPMLTQAAELLISAIYHRELLEKYRRLNEELDNKVKERTRALDKTVNALSESESRFRNLVEQAADAFFVIDIKGRFIDVNKQACESLGYVREELMQMAVSDIDKDFTNERAIGTFEHLLHHGAQVLKGTHIRKNGSIFPVEINVSILEMDNQQYMLAIARDISELKLLEEQFQHSQKMEALGELVGGIAHDFNNILAGITGNLYMARKKMHENPEVAQKLANIEKLSFRAAEMIKQLLTFSRKDIVIMKHLSITSTIREMLTFLRTSMPENIVLHCDICSDSLFINGDDTQLHQILMNLINNARDALGDVDEPCINVRLKSFKTDDLFVKNHSNFKAGFYAHLSVEDNGSGIPEDQVKHLFEPFFTTKEVGKGTGLGLAMVFGAVKTHHGYVEVESIEGDGSTFHLYFPLVEGEDVVSVLPHVKEDTAENHGETILLVDDEIQILEMGKEVLESLGYQVLEASNGLEAVDVFTAHQNEISLIITDIVMPELGGVKSIERIRKIQPDIKVIFSTGYDKDASLPDAIPTGGTPILSKPYNIEELSKTIRNQLDS